MDRNAETGSMKRAGFSLAQETITMLTVGVALAGIMLVSLSNMRAEGRADRARIDAAMAEMRAEGRADRARTDAALAQMRADSRADWARTDAALAEMRAEGRAFREAFARQMARLVEQHGTLSGYVDGLDRAIASSGDRE